MHQCKTIILQKNIDFLTKLCYNKIIQFVFIFEANYKKWHRTLGIPYRNEFAKYYFINERRIGNVSLT